MEKKLENSSGIVVEREAVVNNSGVANFKRGLATVSALVLLLSPFGCARTPGEGDVLAALGTSSSCYTSMSDNTPKPEETSIQDQLQREKEDSIKQIVNWYKTNVASDETICNLWSNDDNSHFCVLKDHLPLYDVLGFCEVTQRVVGYMNKLETLDPSSFESIEEFQGEIREIQEKCGITINDNGSVTFDGISTFDADGENGKKKIVALVDYDKDVTFFSTYDPRESDETIIIEISDDASAIERTFDYSITSNSDKEPTVAYDFILRKKFYDDTEIGYINIGVNCNDTNANNKDKCIYNFKIKNTNGDTIEMVHVSINDILTLCSSIFAENQRYREACEARGIDPTNFSAPSIGSVVSSTSHKILRYSKY